MKHILRFDDVNSAINKFYKTPLLCSVKGFDKVLAASVKEYGEKVKIIESDNGFITGARTSRFAFSANGNGAFILNQGMAKPTYSGNAELGPIQLYIDIEEGDSVYQWSGFRDPDHDINIDGEQYYTYRIYELYGESLWLKENSNGSYVSYLYNIADYGEDYAENELDSRYDIIDEHVANFTIDLSGNEQFAFIFNNLEHTPEKDFDIEYDTIIKIHLDHFDNLFRYNLDSGGQPVIFNLYCQKNISSDLDIDGVHYAAYIINDVNYYVNNNNVYIIEDNGEEYECDSRYSICSDIYGIDWESSRKTECEVIEETGVQHFYCYNDPDFGGFYLTQNTSGKNIVMYMSADLPCSILSEFNVSTASGVQEYYIPYTTGENQEIEVLDKIVSIDVIRQDNGEESPVNDTLTMIEIPSSVTELQEEAFMDCINLNEIYIPKSVTKIGSWSLGANDNLKIYYDGTIDDFKNIETDGAPFGDCDILGVYLIDSTSDEPVKDPLSEYVVYDFGEGNEYYGRCNISISDNYEDNLRGAVLIKTVPNKVEDIDLPDDSELRIIKANNVFYDG